MYRVNWTYTQQGKRYFVIECGFKRYLKKRIATIRKQSNVLNAEMSKLSLSLKEVVRAIKKTRYLFELN